MESLCDMPGRRLIIICAACDRRGSYDLERLRRRFGAHASLYDVYIRLTQTCRFQHEVGARRPNACGRACRAQVATESQERLGTPPSRR